MLCPRNPSGLITFVLAIKMLGALVQQFNLNLSKEICLMVSVVDDF